jgi:peptide-methionine (S)-S-oxide reductase
MRKLWILLTGIRPAETSIVAGFVGFLLLSMPMNTPADTPSPSPNPAANVRLATLGGGCFWCLEAVFERLDGVQSVVSGYAGGQTENPTYKKVCSGSTGHAEVIQIRFDPGQITYEEVLEVFWQAHDPTTLNRQGADVGSQYRSIILYHDPKQKEAAQKSKETAGDMFKRPIVTEIVPLKKFYTAEDHHQDFFRKNPNHPYCVVVIHPKLKKLSAPSK